MEMEKTQLTAVEFLIQEVHKNMEGWIPPHIQEESKKMEEEQKKVLWTNEEVFDMLYKTDKFLMIELREYWKTIKK